MTSKSSNQCCAELAFFLEEKKVQVTYLAKFREYGINTTSGGFQEIFYCPWCGKKFPGSLRDEWFDQLEGMGVDPIGEPEHVPSEFMTDAWWLKGK